MAETHDLLGMTGFLSGDLIQGRDNIGQAIVLFEKMDRLRSLSSSLAVLSGLGSHYQIETLVSPVERPDSLDSAERALKIAQDIGWRAGEAYALCLKSLILGPAGEFGFALETALIARELAREINHRQWLTFTNFSLGVLYHDILAYEASEAHLTTSLEISKEIGSFHWIRSTTGVLGTCLIEQQKLAKASTLLKAAVPEGEGGLYLTLGSRQIGCAQAELALAEGDPARALEVVSQLEATAANFVPGGGSPILRLEMLRGKAFFALGRLADAENALNSARQIAETLSARTHLWRILADLGAVYHQQGKLETSNLTLSEARGMIEKIAATIPDVAIQGVFLERSLRLIQ
jgi:tetratricopeptide (TPR) repeat protein